MAKSWKRRPTRLEQRAGAKKRGQGRKPKYAVWLFDMEMVGRLKARCARLGRSLSGHVEALIRADLGDKPTGEMMRLNPDDVAKALGAEPAGDQPHAPRRPGDAAKRKIREALDANEPYRHLPGGRVESFGPPINDSVVVCRRDTCKHADVMHTRGDQHACGVMGCNCSRFL